jgi:xanthine dehydrogenase accessory factor
MSFDRAALIRACQTHGAVARVVVADVRGSAPREVGAAMLVWQNGFSGTIGGGRLEFEAIRAARTLDEPGARRLTRHALGPELGQCCGGAVSLLSEVYDLARAEALPTDLIVRGEGERPLSVARLCTQVRGTGVRPAAQLIDGWMVEPVDLPARPVWIWGAGHVGRALVGVLSPLPDVQITWVDTARDRFPGDIPAGVDMLVAEKPQALVRHAPPEAAHLILTYSHELDLALCHALLLHGFASAGLIGSATKWARFRSRLAALGHGPQAIARITCPIGDPALGKHPQAIALGVGTALLAPAARPLDLEGTA